MFTDKTRRARTADAPGPGRGTARTRGLRGRLALSVLAGAMAVGSAALTGIPAASADTGMTVTMGTPTVSARLLVTVPVSVVCADIPGGLVTTYDNVTVTISQASSSGVSTATGQLEGGSFFSTSGLFTCDGTTVNNFTFSLVASSPFHGGPAVATVTTVHDVATDPYCLWCAGASESGQLGPIAVTVK